MNSISILNNNSNNLTMSSREIAEIAHARHDSVKRTIERLADKGVIVHPPMVEEQISDKLGRLRAEKVYTFKGEKGKRDSIIVIAQIYPEFTAKLVDRWQELENQNKPQIPTTLPEALRLAADMAEQIEANKPKVLFYDKFADTKQTKTITETAKVLGIPPYTLRDKMIADKILYRQGDTLLPYATYMNKGWFEVKEGIKKGYNYTQTRITAKGEQGLAKRYTMEAA